MFCFFRGGANAAQFGNGPGGDDIRLFRRGPQRHQPAGRRVRERSAAARQHASEDRRAGPFGRAAVRHLADPPGLQRVCLQDTRKVNDFQCEIRTKSTINTHLITALPQLIPTNNSIILFS